MILVVTNEENARIKLLIALCLHLIPMLLPSLLPPHPLGPPSPPGFHAEEFAIAKKRLALPLPPGFNAREFAIANKRLPSLYPRALTQKSSR